MCNRCKEGREDVNDDAHPGLPNTTITSDNVEAVTKIILNNRRITIGEVADNVGISFGSCQVIFTDVLVMKCAVAKIVSKLQNFEPKQCRMDGHRTGDVDDVQQCFGFAQKGYNW